jgi:DNA invertase Pin-like site-specific DNA recombinase
MPAAALYVRVSTDRQIGENQLAELRQLAAARGFEPITYNEVESAAKARPVMDRMLADARAGRVRAILVWALDRLHRSMVGSIQTVLECDRIGVPVISVREPWLDTRRPRTTATCRDLRLGCRAGARPTDRAHAGRT